MRPISGLPNSPRRIPSSDTNSSKVSLLSAMFRSEVPSESSTPTSGPMETSEVPPAFPCFSPGELLNPRTRAGSFCSDKGLRERYYTALKIIEPRGRAQSSDATKREVKQTTLGVEIPKTNRDRYSENKYVSDYTGTETSPFQQPHLLRKQGEEDPLEDRPIRWDKFGI